MSKRASSDTRVVVAVAALVACGALASCFLSGYEKVEGGEGGAGGGTSSASIASTSAGESSSQGSAGGEDLPRCETTETPPRPDDALAVPALDRWFALRVIRLGKPDQPATVPGLDLDDADTCNASCQGEPECAEPDFLADLTPTQEQERCDFANGIDNSTSYLFDFAGTFLQATDADLSTEADAGLWSLLIRLSDWNGEADDEDVTVSLYSTPGFQPAEGGTTSSGAGAGGSAPVAPAWDGTDAWGIDGRSLAQPGDIEQPAFRAGGYVSDGVVVADLGGSFFVGTARLPIAIATGRLLAPLALDDGDPRIRDAVFAGRWPVSDFLAAMGSLVIDGEPFCQQGSFFRNVAQRACRLVDLSVDQGVSECDGLSFGLGFDADLVVPGTIVEPPGPPPECPVVTCAEHLADP